MRGARTLRTVWLALFYEGTIFSFNHCVLQKPLSHRHKSSFWEGSGIKNLRSPTSFGKGRHTWRPSPLTMTGVEL